MGLHVNSISQLPISESRSYYLYVLDYYNWDELLSNTLRNNLEKIERFCAQNDAVMIKGLPESDFSSEVLSWVKINGQNPGEILPAILITTTHPSYFINNTYDTKEELSDSLVFLKIKGICKTPADVISLLEKLFIDIKAKKSIEDFSIVKEQRKGEHGALVDALILEPNLGGFGVDLRKLMNWVKGRMRGNA